MNDFTKEELQILLFWGMDRVENIGKDEFIEEGHDIPFKKLQDMIYNYCEHEFNMNNWINDSSGCRWHECKKCGKFYR